MPRPRPTTTLVCSCAGWSLPTCGWRSSRRAWRRRSASCPTSPAQVPPAAAGSPLPAGSTVHRWQLPGLHSYRGAHPPGIHIHPAACAAAAADVLAARPRRRAGIQLWQGLRHLASLQELRLEHQSGAGMPANALACTGLRGLTLLATAAVDWPLAPHQLSEWLPAYLSARSFECLPASVGASQQAVMRVMTWRHLTSNAALLLPLQPGRVAAWAA